MVRQINDRFLTEPFEWERSRPASARARARSGAAAGLDLFLESCGRTTLARAEPAARNLLREGALPYDARLRGPPRTLWQRLQAPRPGGSPAPRDVDAARAKDPAQAAAFAERYADEIAVRAIDEPGGPMSEDALVLASLGEYSYTDPPSRPAPLPAGQASSRRRRFCGDQIANLAITGLAELHQELRDRFRRSREYFAVTYGPACLRLALMLLSASFRCRALRPLPEPVEGAHPLRQGLRLVKLWPWM
jgi:hypothetical protein